MNGFARLLLFGAMLLVLAWPAVVRAEEPKRVVVAELSGDPDGEIRDALLKGLSGRREVRLVSLEHAKKLADKAGTPLGAPAGARTLGKALGLVAVIEGDVTKSGAVVVAKIRLRGASDGEVIEAHQFRAETMKTLARKLSASARAQLGPALLEAKAPVKETGRRVAVRAISGPKGNAVRGWVQAALKRKKGLGVASKKETDAANIAPGAKPDDLMAAADTIGVIAFVGGTVTLKGASAKLELEVVNAADGKPVETIELEGRGLGGLKKAIDRDLGTRLDGPLASARAPEPPLEQVTNGEEGALDTEEGEGEDEQAEGEKDEPAKGPKRPSPLEIGAGVGLGSRNFRYTDDLFNRLRAYKLGFAPAGFAWARWYPAAHFQGGPVANIGVVLGYGQGIALESEAKTGEKFGTTSREWFAGLRYRIAMDPHELGAQVSYGNQTFAVDDEPVQLVPDVSYGYLRLAADGRARFDRIVAGGHLGYRHVLDPGDISSDRWFPRASVGGFDVRAFGGYEVSDGLDLMLGLDLTRYFYSMNPEPGDPNVAGGALDDYLHLWLGAAYRLPAER